MLSIPEIAATDTHASSVLFKARECAEIYLHISNRQKGCDGMGELAMIKEEFREAVDDLIKYCKGKDCLLAKFDCDLDRVAVVLTNVHFEGHS